MKCEGPSCQPCKRLATPVYLPTPTCQRLKQPCVFGESQGRGRQIVWAKRTEELEARVSKLEEELSETKARVCRVEAVGHTPLSSRNPIARCVATLQTTAKQPSVKRKHSPESPLQDDLQRSPSTRDSMVEGPRTSKAIRAAQFGPRRTDLIERGMLSPEMARRLFEIHQTRWAPQIPWLNVVSLPHEDLPDTFDSVRWHSPLMLAVGCSAGAKGCGDVDTYRKMKAHALELILDVVFYRVFPHDQPQSYQDLIAVIGGIIHCGFFIDPVVVVDHAEYLRLRDVFDRIPEPRWQSEFDQRQLLSVARTFFGVYIHSVLYREHRLILFLLSILRLGKPCVMRIDKSVLILYCKIICNSPYSVPEWDGNLIYFVKYYVIMQEAQENLDSHYRLGSIDIHQRLAVVEKYTALVNHWKRDLDRAKFNFTPAAASEFKHLYHRVRPHVQHFLFLEALLTKLTPVQAFAYLACFVTEDLRNSLRWNKQGLRLAKEGVAHALEVLKQFIDSRRAEPGVPCVHLEYRKCTIAIATACILEGCLLIPEHIDFSYCRKIIETFTDELDKEGGEWGTGTEDKYVKRLRLVLEELDSRPVPPQSANTESDLLPQEETPSMETNEIQSSLPSPPDMINSAGFLGPSALQHDKELIFEAAPSNSAPPEACQTEQLYGGDQFSDSTWTRMMDMPIRLVTPPTSLMSHDQSMTSFSHEPLEGLRMGWYEDQKSYDGMECESSMPPMMEQQSPKVVFSSDEDHVAARLDESGACWKVDPSHICYNNVDSVGYPHPGGMCPAPDGDRRQIYSSLPLQHFPHLIQDGTDSGSSFSNNLSSSFASHPCQPPEDHSQSAFLIHPQTQTLRRQQVPATTFDLIQSLVSFSFPLSLWSSPFNLHPMLIPSSPCSGLPRGFSFSRGPFIPIGSTKQPTRIPPSINTAHHGASPSLFIFHLFIAYAANRLIRAPVSLMAPASPIFFSSFAVFLVVFFSSFVSYSM
ncbi:hypothetical protein VP01_733g3 [Puccinia sorghi]|uniref:Transcription factor domain-containing protein n=1 Tax=Puccinia sorghi TaxID=27349 RepID=A0A0L6UCU2_9BASI|nr:hypothetical protein VP01_733g3 [Puccinia sorghi]